MTTVAVTAAVTLMAAVTAAVVKRKWTGLTTAARVTVKIDNGAAAYVSAQQKH
jgi:hypothetical protein